MTTLTLKQITYRTKEKTLLTVPNLSCSQGEFIGIIGPNGAGKSTLLKIMSLLMKPSTGVVLYHDIEIQTSALAHEMIRKTSFVMQQPLLFNTSVAENVASSLKIRKEKKVSIDAKVTKWLEKLQITHLANRSSRHLSGGEAQRVNLARALISEPEILFLDEPFSGLDYPTKIDLVQQLKEICGSKNMLVVFVSHDLQEIKFLTERLLVVVNGEIVQDGQTKEVMAKPNYLASPFITKLTNFVFDE